MDVREGCVIVLDVINSLRCIEWDKLRVIFTELQELRCDESTSRWFRCVSLRKIWKEVV